LTVRNLDHSLLTFPRVLLQLIMEYIAEENDFKDISRCFESQRVTVVENSSEKPPKTPNQVKLRDYITPQQIIEDRKWLPILLKEIKEPNLLHDIGFLKQSLKSYEKFFYLSQKLHGEHGVDAEALDRLVTPEKDLFWHTHMHFPLHYERDVFRYLGYFLVHNPWPEDKQKEEGEEFITPLWEEFAKTKEEIQKLSKEA